MQVLSAALAFAIIMLVLSMVVSALVETIHRLLGMRERGLYYLLGQFYDQVLKPYAGAPATDQAEDTRAAFQDRMSENRTPVALTASTGPARISYPALDWPHWPAGWSGVPRWLGGFVTSLWHWVSVNWRGRGLSSLSCVGLMERLGGHPLSDAIVRSAEGAAGAIPAAGAGPPLSSDAAAPGANALSNPVDATLQDIAQKFEAYASEASIFFERRARTLSIVVAIVVAFLLHVHAVDIFSTFMRDPAVAEAVIAQKEFVKAFEAKSDAAKKTAQAAVAPSVADLQAFRRAAEEAKALEKEYADSVARFKALESQLSGLGVPIGWTEERKLAAHLWPQWKQQRCVKAGEQPRYPKAGERCGTGEKLVTSIGFGIPTDWQVLLGLLLGGLLVGLGGPFWYDMVNSLTSIRNIARGQGQGTPTQSAQTTPAGAAPGAGGAKETPQPRTPVDAFKAARAGWIAAGRP
jgi:hypothetical protein